MASTPEPPPEAMLLKRVRKARQMTIPQAARLAGISASRWSQIENGYERKNGEPVPVQAPTGTMAHMASALGITAAQLIEVGRGDAVEVLGEIERITTSASTSTHVSSVAGGVALAEVGAAVDSLAAQKIPNWFISELERRAVPLGTIATAVDTLMSVADHFGYTLAELLRDSGLASAQSLEIRDPARSRAEQALAEFDAKAKRILADPHLTRGQRKDVERTYKQLRREIEENAGPPEN